MKKPKNTNGLFVFIMGLLGIIYFVLGLLIWRGVFAASETSQGASLILVGMFFLVVTGISWLFYNAKEKRCRALSETGEKVPGYIVEVAILKHMHWGMMSPIVVKYSFEYQGKTHTAKSGFIWQDPEVYVGDMVEVLVDRRDVRISAYQKLETDGEGEGC